MNAGRITGFAVIIAIGWLVERAHAQAYRVQGTVTYRYLNPGKMKPGGSGIEGEYRRVSQFDLDVNGCLFHFRVVDVSGGGSGIEHHEVGTDGKDLFQQTVFKRESRPGKAVILRGDGSEQTVPNAKDPVNKSAGSIYSGLVPRNRSCHEGAIWFALASHCTYTNEKGSVYRLRDYGDNNFQSFTSMVSLVALKFQSSPPLFQRADFVEPARSHLFPDRQIEHPDLTNTSYVVTETVSVGRLVLPRKFSFTHRQRLWSEEDRSYRVLDSAIYIGEVTNAWEGSILKTHKPSLVTPASLSDHRFYRRDQSGNLAPVTGLFQSWEEVLKVTNTIPLSAILQRASETLPP